MEILTLVKANIRHKKGSFSSILILTLIITLSLTAFLSIRKSCADTVNNSLDYVNAPELTLYIKNRELSDELLESVEESPFVKNVVRESVKCVTAEFNGELSQNEWYFLKYDSRYRLLNDRLTGYSDILSAPKKGEIYLSSSSLNGLKKGDKCFVYDFTNDKKYEFTVAGIVAEPNTGNFFSFFQNVFIGDEDYDMLCADGKSEITMLKIYKKDNCTLSDSLFRRQLNLDTSIVNLSDLSLTRTESFQNIMMFTDIILSILTVFLAFLAFIVVIVMKHSITTSIEIDYTTLGILKAVGFSRRKIRLIYMIQYLSAQLIGAFIGFVAAFPLTAVFVNVFQSATFIPNETHIAVIPSLIIILAMLIISGIFVFIGTVKVNRISPVRAISGGRESVYFDSRLQFPVSKKFLSASLALRQFTSNKRKYLSTILIISLLAFFMITANALGDTVSSKSALENMGNEITECAVNFKRLKIEDFDNITDIENIIGSYASIEKKYYLTPAEISVNGEKCLAVIYKNPESINIAKGRFPKYDNEIAVTDLVAKELQLNIGETVTLSDNETPKKEFIITGIYRSTINSGRCIAMSYEGGKELGVDFVAVAQYSLGKNPDYNAIIENIQKKYGDIVDVSAQDISKDFHNAYSPPANAVKFFIYGFSILFAAAVMITVCQKMFLREKTDIGIYKAVGFRTISLRLQFAIRFAIVAFIGSLAGSVLSILFSEKLLFVFLRSLGISAFTADFTLQTFLVPSLILIICCFVFSYLVSGQVKKVDIKQLITE